jgi:hypothetical protein
VLALLTPPHWHKKTQKGSFCCLHLVAQGPTELTIPTTATITKLALPSARLTHGRCGQCLSPHNLGRSKPIQEITELAFSSQPGGREDEPAGEGRGARDGGVGCSGCVPGHWALPLCLSFSSTVQMHYTEWGQTTLYLCILKKNIFMSL